MDAHTLSESLEHFEEFTTPSATNGYMYEPLERVGEVHRTNSDCDSDSIHSLCSSEGDGKDAVSTRENFTCDSDDMGYPDPAFDLSVPKWCACNNCREMPSEVENRCCHMTENSLEDSLKLQRKVEDTTGDPQCITQHQGFIDCCLSIHVLKMCFHMYIKEEGPLGDNELIHEVYRYLAYRNFARFIWGILGRRNRKVIPACAVLQIRQAFPSEAYTGFKY